MAYGSNLYGYHDTFKNTNLYDRLVDQINRTQWQGASVWEHPTYLNWLDKYKQSQLKYYPSQIGQRGIPSNWALRPGYENSMRNRYYMPNNTQQPAPEDPKVMAGRQQLASIADQLRNKKLPPPAIPTKPGVKAIPAPVAPEYVQSDRLLAGKGFSKFKRQARGTDRYAIVKQLIDQYYK